MKFCRNKYLLLADLFLMIFILLFISIKLDLFVGFDHLVGEWIRNFRSQATTDWMKAITQLGTPMGTISAFILFWIYSSIRRNFLGVRIVMISLLGSLILNLMVKEIVSRPRPPMFLWLIYETEWSFPSGHAMISLTFYGMIAYLIWDQVNGMKRFTVWWFSLVGLVLLWVGVSRVYLGVHYPSDILAGYALGAACLTVCIWLYHRIKKEK